MSSELIVFLNGLSIIIQEIIKMNVDNDLLTTQGEAGCHATLLPGTDTVVVSSVKNDKIASDKPKKIIIILSAIVLIQIAALVFLVYDKLVVSDQLNDQKLSAQCTIDSTSFIPDDDLIKNGTSKDILRSEIEELPNDYLSSDIDYSYDAASNSNLSSSLHYEDDGAPWEMYDIQPRCFSMCEPPELFFRETISFLFCA